jgi:hypothetical protein
MQAGAILLFSFHPKLNASLGRRQKPAPPQGFFQ